MVLFEVCANSIASCIAAQSGGANRIELCSALEVGGITPSAGLLAGALKEVDIPIYPIIRPRGGDFLYSSYEVGQMKDDIRYLRELGASGFVLGALNSEGHLDMNICRSLIRAADGLPVTLHRAFDMSRDLSKTLEEAIDLGFTRILTSGGKQTAEEGASKILDLVHQSSGSITIMAGAGITEFNVEELIKRTGVREIHASCQSRYASAMKFCNKNISFGDDCTHDEYSYMATDVNRVRAINHII